MAATQTARDNHHQQQQQQQAPQPRVLYRRPTSVGVARAGDEWTGDDAPALTSPMSTRGHSARGTSAPSPSTRTQRSTSQHVMWARDAYSPVARHGPRPASAAAAAGASASATGGFAAATAMAAAAAAAAVPPPPPNGAGEDTPFGATTSGSGPAAGSGLGGAGGSGSFSARLHGGSPSLNAAAAALAERQVMAEAITSLRPHCRCCKDGFNPPSSIGGHRKDVEGLSEEVRRLRGELLASQDQNRLIRTEKQRLEEELNRCRTNLVKAEEILNARERSLSPNTGMSRMYRTSATTALVTKLREQLAAQQSQIESLKAQLDEIVKGTRATRMSELQAEVKAQDRELRRQAEMIHVMKKRMEEAEATAAEAMDRCANAERLARMVGPMATLQQAITASETKFSHLDRAGASGEPSAAAVAPPGSPAAGGTGGKKGPASGGEGAGAPAESGGGKSSGGSGGGGAGGGAAAAAAVAAAGGDGASKSPLSGGQTLSSGRIKKTMAALADAHRALLSQATLLTEVFPPGLTTEQLSVRAALRPATQGAPEVLRYLRHHVHKMVDVLTVLPGNRLELIPDEEPAGAANGNGRHNRNGANGRNGQQRGTPRSSMSGQGLRSSGGGKGRSGGGASGGGAAAGGGGAPEDPDPWSLLNELLDFVRWLRGLDRRSLENRPDLEPGLEQLSTVVGICEQETRRLLGRLEGVVAGNGA